MTSKTTKGINKHFPFYYSDNWERLNIISKESNKRKTKNKK